MIDHRDLVLQAFAANPLPSPPRAVADVAPILFWLLEHLPQSEQAGFTQSSAGAENTIRLDDGTYVRVARVSYPNGQIYKFMNDVPNGGPQWVAEDVRPDLYMPYRATGTPVPPTTSTLEARVTALERLVPQLAGLEPVDVLRRTVAANHDRMEAINARFDRDIAALRRDLAALQAAPAPAKRPSWWPFG